MKLHKIGMFKIATEMLENHTEAVLNLMAAMIPFDVRWDYFSDSFEYTCHSELFPELKPGESPTPHMVHLEDGKLWLEVDLSKRPKGYLTRPRI